MARRIKNPNNPDSEITKAMNKTILANGRNGAPRVDDGIKKAIGKTLLGKNRRK